MKTIDFSYFIERYIAGEMDQPEKRWFEMELEGNDSLRKEVALRKRADAALVRHDIISLRNKLTAIEAERREKLVASGEKKTPRFRYAAAIAALMLLGGAYLLTSGHQGNDTLYRKNFQAFESSVISRSGELRSSDLSKALDLYYSNDFKGAALHLKNYLVSYPQSVEAKFLYGISEMENSNFDAAKSSFRSIIANADNLYIDKANWYLALCFLKTNETIQAVTQLESVLSSNSIFSEKARKLIKKLK